MGNILFGRREETLKAKGQDPVKIAQLCARAINESIANRPDDLLVTMHICRGNFKSTYLASGGYEGYPKPSSVDWMLMAFS